MKISVFTPTHRIQHLQQAYDSLMAQGDVDWEWVIVPNGEALMTPDKQSLKAFAEGKPRVRIVPFPLPADLTNIGALKRFACKQCTGDVFLELDHDDLLVPRTLPKVVAAAEAGAGFIYSDCAVFVQTEDDLKSWGFDTRYGWQTYRIKVYGEDFIATRAFDPTPRSLCEVYYAPDHLRAWTRETYERVGGHNEALQVGDDHELVCRTYLVGARFCHIGDCGYLYRWHPNNSFKLLNKGVQMQSAANCKKFLSSMISEWAHRVGNIEYIGVAADLPCRQSLFGHINAQNIQYLPREYVADWMEKAWTALLPGGYLTVMVPVGEAAAACPSYKSTWNASSFLYYTRREFNRRLIPDCQARFQLISAEEFSPAHDDRWLTVRLAALKGQRWPGPVHI